MVDNQDKKRTYMVDMGKRLHLFRSMIRKNQKEMSVVIGVSEGQYRRYEKGKIPIPADKLLILYKNYDLNQNWLLSGEGNMKAHQYGREDYEDKLREEIKSLREENQRLHSEVARVDKILGLTHEERGKLQRNRDPQT